MGSTRATATLTTTLSARWREIGLVVSILVGLFALVSMVGWRASDPSWVRPGTGLVENPCGIVGATVADLAFGLVGHGAWTLVLGVAVAILALIGRRVLDPVRWVAFSALFVSVLAGMHLALRPGDPHSPGGIVGRLVTETLELGLGTVGTCLAVAGVFAVALTVLFRIRWSRVVIHSVELLERAMPHVRRAAGRAGQAVVAQGSVGARSAGGASARAARLAARSAGGVASGLGGRLGGIGRRMVRSLTRREPEEEDVFESDWDDNEDDDEVSTGIPPGLDVPTAVGRAPVALAEVEWEPTVSSANEEVLDLFPSFERRSSVEPSRVMDEPTQESVPADLDDMDADSELEEELPEIPSVARIRIPTPPATQLRVATPAPVAVGPGVVVHENRFLDARVQDDGQALLRSVARFELPKLSLLDEVPEQKAAFDADELRQMAAILEEKLESFKITGQVTGVRPGPVVTTFEFLPEAGIKVSRIASLEDDLAMALKAVRVRIVAPIPGKGVVGIEIPSARRLTVYLREMFASPTFRDSDAHLPVALGKDVEGRPVVGDLAKMPHLLIGGTTGSGKSVGVNGMLLSLLFRMTPDELRLLLIDPKMLEFEMYGGIPHLLHPVVTEPKVAAQALAWACREMDERYTLLARWGTRNIVSYNAKVDREMKSWTREKAVRYTPKHWPDSEPPPEPKKLPYIVIIIDELADLMMVASKDVEENICRIAQKARACGIHLLVATQRPSVDVVTGLIKANLPTRIAFQLRSRHDSRTVLDEIGAENLLGRGDMLYMPPGLAGLQRLHGAFVSDEEVARVTAYLQTQAEPEFIDSLEADDGELGDLDLEDRDELYDAAVQVVVQAGKASTSMVQRHLKIGYNRAARILDMMELLGVVGPPDGARPREVLIASGDLP